MRLILPAVCVAVAVLSACGKTAPAPDPIRAVRTLTVTSQSAQGAYEYAGEVRARTESRLGFRVGGKITRRAVDLGDSVKAGQLLAQIDPQDLRLGQDAARAQMVAAQANLSQAAADRQRFKELRDQGFISSAELERRDTTLKAAQAQFDEARAQSSVQGNQASYASLLSGAAGVVTAVKAEPGMVVAAGEPIVRLAHDGPRDVVFSVPEDKVGLVKALSEQPGRFTVRLWGSDSPALPAHVREISASADPVTRTFLVKPDIGEGGTRAAPGGQAVRLGQTATVIVELPQPTGITRLPLSALREAKGRSTVWLVDRAAMTVKVQPVQVSGADGNDAVVTGGLSPGDVVVTAGVHVLNPGQKVRFYVDPGAPPASATPVRVQ